MNSDEIIDMGNYCQQLSVNPKFNELYALFERQVVNVMLATKPSEEKTREKLYSSLQGLRDFVGYMQEFVVEKNKLTEPKQTVDQTDDPSVHDIYRED